jgi:hypothetical protein
MADQIVIEYVAKMDKLQSELRETEKQQLALDKTAKATSNTITKESEKAAKSVNKVEKSTSGLKDSFKTLSNNLPFAGITQQAEELSTAFTGVTQSVGKTTGALNILKVAFASIGLGALLVAFGSLVAYFKSTEEGGDKLAKVMRVVGAVFGEVVKVAAQLGGFLVDGTEAIYDFIAGEDEAISTTDDYRKSVTELASEIADLEDKIGALTITIERQNDKIQTGIEINLKALRNRNATLNESEKIIDKIGNLEEEKLGNSIDLINQKIALERKSFILKTKDFGDDKQRIEELQELERISLQNGNEDGIKFAREELKRFDVLIEKNRQKVNLFDKFVNDQITAETLLNEAKGTFTEEDAKRIADILKQRESATRESLVLDERLENFRTAAFEKDKARQEKAKQDADKAFADKLKQIELQEKLAVGFAKIEEREATNIIAIQQDFNAKKVKLFQDNNKTRESDYQELLLNQKVLEKEYTDFLEKEDDIRLKNEEANNLRKQKEHEAQIAKDKALDDQAGEDLNKMSMDFANKEIAEIKRVEEEDKKSKEKRLQYLIGGIDLASQALNGFADLQHAKSIQEIDEERSANETKANNEIQALQRRNEEGIISDAQFAAKKAQIDEKLRKKEAQLKKRQFEADQKAALIRIAIDTAVSVAKTAATAGYPAAIPLIVLALAQGAIQAALVKSQPVPKFKDGVIDLQGKGTSTSDSISAKLSRGESVMTAKETKQHKPLFKAIREGSYDDYINRNHILPHVKKLEKEQREASKRKEGFTEKLMESIALNSVDTSHLERLTKKNGTVKISNTQEIVDGLKQVMKPKSRGL